MKITGLFSELREKENVSKKVRIITDENDNRIIKLLFHTPGGEDKMSDRVPITDGAGEFALPNSLLDMPGVLKIQAYAYGDGELLEKSAIYEFKVKPSIDPEDAIPLDEEGLTTLETALVRLDRLEEEKKVFYSEQELSSFEMRQARSNIGIVPVVKESEMTLPVGLDIDGRFYTTPYDDSAVVKSVNGETVDGSGNVSIHIPTKIAEMNEDAAHRTVTDSQKTRIDNSVQTSDVINAVTDGSNKVVTSGAVYVAVNDVYTAVQDMIGDIDSVVQKISDVIGGDEP